MINYSIVMRSVNANLFEINQAKSRIKAAQAAGQAPAAEDVALVGTEKQNAFAVAQYSEVMNIEKFARHIASHGCVYSRADISAILYMAVDCMREMLLDGKKIRLGDLGDFSVSLSSKGAESAEKFSAQNITGININWEAGNEFKNLMTEAEFNLVASRQAQAAVIKAVKATTPLPPHPSGISISSIGGKTYGQLLTMVPGVPYRVIGTKLDDLSSDEFHCSEGKDVLFEPTSGTEGTLTVYPELPLSTEESTITVEFGGTPVFMIKAKGV